MVVQFKCYVCSDVVENIPYCGKCEVALPNCCKVNGYKCSDCNHSKYCAHAGIRAYYTKEQLATKVRKIKKKLAVKNICDEDADLLNDFENNKAAQILKIVHSGINKKKVKQQKFSRTLKLKSQEKRRFIYERDSYQCLKCGSYDDLTLDHIVARANGGNSREENLQTLCGRCNRGKGTQTVDYRKSNFMTSLVSL